MESKLIGIVGLFVFLILAWSLSLNRKLFPWRTVFWGIGLQFGFAFLILKTSFGRQIFDLTGKAITKLIGFANEGCRFVFGPLATDTSLTSAFGPENSFVFAITVTGSIIFISALSSLFYHWGILQLVVRAFAWIMRKAMRTSGSETLSAAANIFMGQTEAPLLIKPYIPKMTRSELLCMMTGGMATIAGGVASVYVMIANKAGHPDFAGHLLTASVMNAPGALLISKILSPETEKSETAGTSTADVPKTTTNAIDALCRGAGDGLFLSLNVIAMLIAFIAGISLINYLVTAVQSQAGVAHPVTLQAFLGWINSPIAWLMGIPSQDCLSVGQIMGERIVMNEFIGYVSLNNDKLLSPGSYAIATYALCGFANFGSIAIQVGGIGSLAPERRGEMAKLGVRAMIGGLLACYLSATIAGIVL